MDPLPIGPFDNIDAPVLPIQDLEGWLHANGLRSEDDIPEQEVTADELACRMDLEEQRKHVQSVYDAAFPGFAGVEESGIALKRKQLLPKLIGAKIDIKTRDGRLSGIPVFEIAKSCDTVLTMMDWPDRSSADDFCLDLSSFDTSSVLSFIQCLTNSSYASISDEALIECCYIAHYLCANKVVDDIVEIMIKSIDSPNCYLFCQIGSELDLPILFERSLAHLMNYFGDFESDPAWPNLNDELQDKIKMIKSAMQSSIHSGSRLYFGSMEEYIAIFAERVEYYRARLAEAKEQLDLSSFDARIDTEKKIRSQEKRLRTLEIAYREHKKIFLAKPRECSQSK